MSNYPFVTQLENPKFTHSNGTTYKPTGPAKIDSISIINSSGSDNFSLRIAVSGTNDKVNSDYLYLYKMNDSTTTRTAFNVASTNNDAHEPFATERQGFLIENGGTNDWHVPPEVSSNNPVSDFARDFDVISNTPSPTSYSQRNISKTGTGNISTGYYVIVWANDLGIDYALGSLLIRNTNDTRTFLGVGFTIINDGGDYKIGDFYSPADTTLPLRRDGDRFFGVTTTVPLSITTDVKIAEYSNLYDSTQDPAVVRKKYLIEGIDNLTVWDDYMEADLVYLYTQSNEWEPLVGSTEQNENFTLHDWGLDYQFDSGNINHHNEIHKQVRAFIEERLKLRKKGRAKVETRASTNRSYVLNYELETETGGSSSQWTVTATIIWTNNNNASRRTNWTIPTNLQTSIQGKITAGTYSLGNDMFLYKPTHSNGNEQDWESYVGQPRNTSFELQSWGIDYQFTGPYVEHNNEVFKQVKAHVEHRLLKTGFGCSEFHEGGGNIYSLDFYLDTTDSDLYKAYATIVKPNSAGQAASHWILDRDLIYKIKGFNGDKLLGVHSGIYTIKNIPTSHPIRFFTGDESSKQYGSDISSKLTVESVNGNDKKGRVLERVAGICDGRSVLVSSGTYTFQTGVVVTPSNTTYVDITGSYIKYKAPSGTQQIVYEVNVAYSRSSIGSANDKRAGGRLKIQLKKPDGGWTDVSDLVTKYSPGVIHTTQFGNIGNTKVSLVIQLDTDNDDLSKAKISSWPTDGIEIKIQGSQGTDSTAGLLSFNSKDTAIESTGTQLCYPVLDVTAIGTENTLDYINGVTKLGRVLERIGGICDGRTVTSGSNTYTLSTGTVIEGDGSSYKDLTGSYINYKAPTGTKQVVYEIGIAYSRLDGDAEGALKVQLKKPSGSWTDVDNLITTYGSGASAFTKVCVVISIDSGYTDNLSQAKLSAWPTDGLGIQVRCRTAETSTYLREIWWNRGRYYPVANQTNTNQAELLLYPVLDVTAIGDETLGLTRTGSSLVLERLSGICDGRTVSSGDYDYTLGVGVPVEHNESSSSSEPKVIPGSKLLNYKPPSTTKQILYELSLAYGIFGDENSTASELGQVVGGVEIQLNTAGTWTRVNNLIPNYGRSTSSYTKVAIVIDVTGGSDDLANGKIGSIPEGGLSIRLRGKKAPWHLSYNHSDDDVKIVFNASSFPGENTSSTYTSIFPILDVTAFGTETLTTNQLSNSFYTGTVNVTFTDQFNEGDLISYECKNHGLMGGYKRIKYSSSYQYQGTPVVTPSTIGSQLIGTSRTFTFNSSEVGNYLATLTNLGTSSTTTATGVVAVGPNNSFTMSSLTNANYSLTVAVTDLSNNTATSSYTNFEVILPNIDGDPVIAGIVVANSPAATPPTTGNNGEFTVVLDTNRTSAADSVIVTGELKDHLSLSDIAFSTTTRQYTLKFTGLTYGKHTGHVAIRVGNKVSSKLQVPLTTFSNAEDSNALNSLISSASDVTDHTDESAYSKVMVKDSFLSSLATSINGGSRGNIRTRGTREKRSFKMDFAKKLMSVIHNYSSKRPIQLPLTSEFAKSMFADSVKSFVTEVEIVALDTPVDITQLSLLTGVYNPLENDGDKLTINMKNSNTIAVTKVGETYTVEMTGETNDTQTNLIEGDVVNYKNVTLTLGSATVIHDVDIPCLLGDTRVVTPNGNVMIQDLTEDDVVLSQDGRVLPIQTITCVKTVTTIDNAPYLIPKDYFGKNNPGREVWVSPDHAILVNKNKNEWFIPCVHGRNTKLERYPLNKKITYYNIGLPDWLTDHFIVEKSLVVESNGGNYHRKLQLERPLYGVLSNGLYERKTGDYYKQKRAITRSGKGVVVFQDK